MFAFVDTPLLPEQASEFSLEYDVLFWYITGVSALGAGVVYSLLIYQKSTSYSFENSEACSGRIGVSMNANIRRTPAGDRFGWNQSAARRAASVSFPGELCAG